MTVIIFSGVYPKMVLHDVSESERIQGYEKPATIISGTCL